MSGDYISRAAAINKIMENIVHQDSRDINLHNIGLRKAMSAIDSLPAADVVEVVRCRDCIHYNDKLEMYCDCVCTIRHYCDGSPMIVGEDDYCSSGKRMDGGQDE